MRLVKFLALVGITLLLSLSLNAQAPSIKAKLVDASSGEAIGFATVSLTREGQTKAYKYVLSNENGELSFEGVARGKYKFKVELLGYKTHSQTIEYKLSSINLGTIKISVDAEQLDAAQVSALGNQVVIKKDTIEYNATTFRTTENDVLEDLLKKLPGVEVEDDGTIKVNGESIKKITIDGKTFFLDDPQMASKNIPAKLVNKLKVIKKKSEQAEFTGIDDGQEENVIDLSVKPGMMNGLLGNVVAGAGHDVPSKNNTLNDTRYMGNAFIGRFSEKTQISLILNGNNTNNQGSSNRSGMMMGNMMMVGGRGMGGGGGGINTTYMAGANIAGSLFEDRMQLGGNYIFNSSDKISDESSCRISYLPDYDLINNTHSRNVTKSLGHSIGLRLDHKFSSNTSILFEPQINFGSGAYTQNSNDTTYRNDLNHKLNEAYTNNEGSNRNVSVSGYLLFRQRLGIPGRTLTAMVNASYSNNILDGFNRNGTYTFTDGVRDSDSKIIDQRFNNVQRSNNLSGTITYTEPLGDFFYIEGNYSYRTNRSVSNKETFDTITGEKDYAYSNEVINDNTSQTIGVNALYQNSTFRAQLGFSAMPIYTHNSTTSYDQVTQQFTPREYTDNQWKFSPSIMLFGNLSDASNLRVFYRGSSNQPSTSQLIPVPDNSDPLNLRFGNPNLKPYFSHSINGNYRYSNRQKFNSVNLRFNASYVDQPIINAIWYGNNGGQYNMPINGPSSYSLGLNFTGNFPIGSTKLTLSNTTGSDWSQSGSYIGRNIDMTDYTPAKYYSFMEEFTTNLQDPDFFASHITETTTKSLSINERLRLSYRGESFEASVSGRTRMRSSWYDGTGIMERTTTWNNTVSAEFIWNWSEPGISFDTDFDYRWYNGYTTPQDPQAVLNAELSKLLFNRQVTLALRAYDILGQSRNLNVTDSANYHNESVTNTLGRYIILSFTWRFGTMGGRQGRGGGPMGGGPMGGGPMGGGPMGGGPGGPGGPGGGRPR